MIARPFLLFQHLFERVQGELMVVQRVETQRGGHGMGSQVSCLDSVDVAEPPEVLTEGTSVVEEDGRLTVPGQGLTAAMEQDFSAHAEARAGTSSLARDP